MGNGIPYTAGVCWRGRFLLGLNMAKILENTLDGACIVREGNWYSVTHRASLGSPLGMCVRPTLFPSLLLASLLGVVGHHHRRERVYGGGEYHPCRGERQTSERTIKLSARKHRRCL